MLISLILNKGLVWALACLTGFTLTGSTTHHQTGHTGNRPKTKLTEQNHVTQTGNGSHVNITEHHSAAATDFDSSQVHISNSVRQSISTGDVVVNGNNHGVTTHPGSVSAHSSSVTNVNVNGHHTSVEVTTNNGKTTIRRSH